MIDDDISKIQYKLAKCCNPIKGDDVFGFVTLSAGITIHRCDCPNASPEKQKQPGQGAPAAAAAAPAPSAGARTTPTA